ncbi:MAG TPA: site-specific integrase [Tepidisphaeraceae bacterium]|jgi:integrase|nr:site-specific integrase [Tepidisphaeraceae bacterium]
MPKLITQVPKLCRHQRGQAFVKIGGQQIWLGRYGEPLTREKYDRLVGQWLANGRVLPEPPPTPADTAPVTILQILAPYWRWAKERYTPSEVLTIKSALRIAEALYGSVSALEFGPNALRAVRAEMIRRQWTRRQINRQISRVRALFRWAASHELIPERIYNQLRTVEPLRRGEAAERPRVKPVPRPLIRVVRRRVSRQVRALIDLQLLTGARADELLRLRATDIDRSRDVWSFNPAAHKTAHHEKERWIYFGPRSQRILRLFMKPGGPADAPLFSPTEAERERHDRAAGHRRIGQKPNPRRSDRTLGQHYTTASYRRSIHRALADAFPTPDGLDAQETRQWRKAHAWGPHRLRHNAATFLRREFGLEVAMAILGHSSVSTTQIYAEQDQLRALRAIAEVG